MANMSILIAAVLACSVLAAVNAAELKSYPALYKIGSGVDKYKQIADEVCTILDAASAKDFDKVKTLYGKGGKASAGYADSLKAFALTDFSAQRYFGMAQKYWGSAGWMDSFISSAIDATDEFTGMAPDVRAQGIMKTAQSGISVQLMLKELDTAATDMSSKNYDAGKGAPHALDESFAVFGTRPTCGPYNLGDKYANQFGTILDCQYNTSTANKKIVDGYIAAYAAAKKGDKATFDSSTAAIVQGIIEVHIQAVLNYAKKMVAATGSDQKIKQAEGYIFYRTIAPFVAGADPKADKTIMSRMKMNSAIVATSYTEVQAAFASVYAALKVDTNNIGAWKDSPSVTCAAKNAAASTAVKAFALFAGLFAAIVAALL